MAVYVTDTHPIVWYATRRHRRLSRRALSCFEAAQRERALIYVPAAAFWEIALLVRVGKIALAQPFPEWMHALLRLPGYDLAPLDARVIAEASQIALADPFDAVIAATAAVLDLPLITHDAEIQASRVVEIAW